VTGPAALAGFIASGILPALAVAGWSAPAVFLAPLLAALQAGLAATATFALPGSFGAWTAVVVTVANLASALALRRRWVLRREHPPAGGAWPAVEILVVGAAVLWPLLALSAPIIGYDAEAIWFLHAAMVFGGHGTLVQGLLDRQEVFSNPDYPPLVPGAVAVAYELRGGIDQYLATVTTAVLNATALGLVGTGLLRLVPAGTAPWRRLAVLAVVALYVGAATGFAGVYAVNGYADLLWAAAAAGAVTWGLVLPPRPGHAAVAACCLAVAAMTKNEGMVVGAGIACLMTIRFRDQWGGGRLGRWMSAAAVGFCGLVPGLAWAGTVRLRGLHDAFFASPQGEALSLRLGATLSGLWAHLHLVPVAAAIALGGVVSARRARERPVGSSRYVWLAAAWAFAAFVCVYTAGSLEIHYWLFASAERTIIFVNICAFLDVAVWATLIVLERPESHRRSPNLPGPARGSRPGHPGRLEVGTRPGGRR
jgi:hypothetical protein